MFRHWVSWKEGRFSHLFVAPADGSAPPRDVTPGEADVPPFSLGGPDDYAFSPDSKELAFARKTDPVEATSTNSDLFVLDLDGPGGEAAEDHRQPGGRRRPGHSPDGRFIAYRAQHRPGFEADRWQLMLFDRKTGEHRSITAGWDRSPDSYVVDARFEVALPHGRRAGPRRHLPAAAAGRRSHAPAPSRALTASCRFHRTAAARFHPSEPGPRRQRCSLPR